MGQMDMEQNDSRQERRSFSRIPFNGKVTVENDQSQWVTDMLDISMKGVLVSRPAEWPARPGDDFHLKLSLDDRNQITIAMDVSLIHDSNACLGFRCDHIDLESMTHLRRLLELNLGDEERINRELSALIYMHGNRSDES
jgi:PilZ domain